MHVVAGLDAGAGPDLVLPLAGHDLSVDTAHRQAGLKAQVEVLLADEAAERHVRPNRAVVGALRTW